MNAYETETEPLKTQISQMHPIFNVFVNKRSCVILDLPKSSWKKGRDLLLSYVMKDCYVIDYVIDCHVID